MNYVFTDGKNKDFIKLCQQLDDYLNEVVGGEKQREQYIQFNTLEEIHDVILLYHDECPIACASFKYYDDGIAEVKRVFLQKEYRGQGLSKKLMKQLEEKAKEQGFHQLILETGNLLAQAKGLYFGLGFKVIENYGQYKNMSDSVCMSKYI